MTWRVQKQSVEDRSEVLMSCIAIRLLWNLKSTRIIRIKKPLSRVLWLVLCKWNECKRKVAVLQHYMIFSLFFFCSLRVCINNPKWTVPQQFTSSNNKSTRIYSYGLDLHSANECLFFVQKKDWRFCQPSEPSDAQKAEFTSNTPRSSSFFLFFSPISSPLLSAPSSEPQRKWKSRKISPARRTSRASAVNRPISRKFRLEEAQHRLSFSFFFITDPNFCYVY